MNYRYTRLIVVAVAVILLGIIIGVTTVLTLPDDTATSTVTTAQQEVPQIDEQQEKTPPPESRGFHHENDDSEADESKQEEDEEEEDPYRMVRVVVTIQNASPNEWQVTVNTSASSGSGTGRSADEPSPWRVEVTNGTQSSPSPSPSSSSSSSSPQGQFIPEPWLQQHYQDAQAVSQIRRTTDPATTSVVTFDIPQYRISELQSDPRIASVQKDTLVHPMQPLRRRLQSSLSTDALSGQEEIGWGIPVVMGTPPVGSTTKLPDTPPTLSSSSSEDCFKICMVDAGVLLNHPDLPNFASSTNSHIWGRSFNLPYQQTWDRPVYNHGTHVMGILTAMANNNIGIQGVLGNAYTENMCFVIARVFDDFGNGQLDSYILNAVEWCADQNVRIINLSLGSPTSNTSYAKEVYDQIAANNTLIVSSAGNTYDTTYNYPASFDSVISVGAIDAAYQKASFSTYNDQVNLVAPGVAIKSTVPQASIVIPSTNTRYKMSLFQYSTRQNVPLTGTLVDCAYAQSDLDCPVIVSGDKICLASRGENVSSYEKALICQRSGGIAMIIYDNVTDYQPLRGTLNITGEWISIPVVGITKRDGEALVAYSRTASSTTLTLDMVDPGYEEISGTSMAVPFVSGIAAKIWYLRPQCRAEQVRQALYLSAKKLFSGVSDDHDRWYFGNGLVQAEGAYHALLQMPYPCGEGSTTTPSEGVTNRTTANATVASDEPFTVARWNTTNTANNTGYQPNDWWRNKTRSKENRMFERFHSISSTSIEYIHVYVYL